jgi:hypothetical protein
METAKQKLDKFYEHRPIEDRLYSEVLIIEAMESYARQMNQQTGTNPLVSGSFLCGGCNVREPHEHRCHGEGCKCDNPICMEHQGRITHEQLMEIVNSALAKNDR